MELDEFGREIPFGVGPVEWARPQQVHNSYNPERKSSPWKMPRKSLPEESVHLPMRRMISRERSWSPDTQRPQRRRDRKERGNSDPPSPFSKYTQQPVLCERLWQDQKNFLDGHGNRDVNQSLPFAIGLTKADPLILTSTPSKGQDEPAAVDSELIIHTAKSPSYQQYVHNYCIEFVRAFFDNHHEESWFRQLYSPLEYKRMILKFFDMAKNEAASMMQEITELGTDFVINARLGSGIKMNATVTPSPMNGGKESMIHKRRTHDEFVGKPSESTISTLSSSDKLNAIPLTHVHHAFKKKAVLKIIQVPPFVSDSQLLQALNELAHCSDPIPTLDNSAVEFIDSPSVNGIFGISAILASDMNPWLCGLTQASREDTTGTTSDEITISNSAALLAAWTAASSHDKNHISDNLLYRTCWALLPSIDYKNKLLQTLSKIKDDMESSDDRDEPHNNHYLPSRRETNQDFLKLSIDISDPYGRLEVDADGHGGNSSNENAAPTERSTITQRKCTVLVCNDVTSLQPISISVLSAAISSSKRIHKDKESALSIARALDVMRRIPKGLQIDDLLSKVLQLQSTTSSMGTSDTNLQSDQDLLDVTIAYLRRVHLLSYYNCCKLADNFGAAFGTNHPVGTIYLRLKGADEILEKMNENNESGYKKTDTMDENKSRSDDDVNNDKNDAEPQMDADTDRDMLVRLLDQNIKRALECCSNILAVGEVDHILNESLENVAVEIESMEEKTKVLWVNDHCVLDSDGRARCTFHFCRKLFKDKSFLEKHLTKKHDEYLKAELAKSHDSYVRQIWEQDTHRPVPPILIDCGMRFGLKPCTIRITDGQYGIDDPEPDLVRISDERIQMERQREADEMRRREYHYRFNEERRNKRPFTDNLSDGNTNVEAFAPVDNDASKMLPNRPRFVDVDDMKDEKVKLSFENIDVSKVTKSKKKKKLL